MQKRRTFLKSSIAASIGLAAPLSTLEATSLKKLEEKIPDNLTVLFQGDSITDAGRRKDRYYANEASGMGNGYVAHIVTHLLGNHSTSNIRCYNRGISGHKVFQLANRWEDDCLNLKPDVLSILIGVNDFWHTLTHGYAGTSKVYEEDLRKLLDRTKNALPDVKLMIAEPFVVKGGTSIKEKDWFPAFQDYQASAAQIAKDYEAAWVPYQKAFDEAMEKNSVKYWCPDGVHPSMAGSYLMAKEWLKAFSQLY